MPSKTLRWLVVSSQAESAVQTRKLQMSLDGGSLVPVTRASGYIGGRLLKALESAGRPVRCLARRPIFFDQESLHPRKLSKADCLERSSAPAARGGVHTAHPDPPSPKPMNRLHRAFPYTAYTVFFHLGTPVRHAKPIANSQSEQWHFRVFAKSRYH